MTFSKPLIVPTVNLNGSSKESLVNALVDARETGAVFMFELGKCFPHGRDYQTMSAGSTEAARDAFGERVRALSVFLNELEELAVAIDQQ